MSLRHPKIFLSKIFLMIKWVYKGFLFPCNDFKTRPKKCNSQKWFHGEVVGSIVIQDQLFKSFKRSQIHVDKTIYNNQSNLLVDFPKKEKIPLK